MTVPAIIDADPSPDDYADTVEAQLIVEYVTNGDTLIDACRFLGVPIRTIYGRLERWPRFAAAMEEARAKGYDAIANNARRTVRGEPGFTSGDWKRDKLIAETDLKLLAKWHPKKYGEKLEIEQRSATIAIPVSDDPVVAQRAYEDLMKGT
jgi:hypothetical protein